jgi:hypothetical protein
MKIVYPLHRGARLFDFETPTVICGGHAATFVRRRVGLGHFHFDKESIDLIDSTWKDERILALYFFPSGAQPNEVAEASIKSVCPHSSEQ